MLRPVTVNEFINHKIQNNRLLGEQHNFYPSECLYTKLIKILYGSGHPAPDAQDPN